MKNSKKIEQQAVQFIGTTPDEVTHPIIEEIRFGFNKLLKEFQPKEPTQYLTRNEVKELLNVDLSTIHNWTKRGKIRAYGIGSRVYYKRAEIEESIIPLN